MLSRILLDPDAGLGGGGDGTLGAPAPETSAPSPTLDSTAGLDAGQLSSRPDFYGADTGTPAATGSVDAALAAPADPNIAAAMPAATAPPQTAAEQQAATIRDAARMYGLDLSNYEDDATAFAHLVQMANAGRQNDYYTQLGRQIAPHYQGVSQYLQQQQASHQPPAERKAWEAPEFDDRWLQLVDKDPNTGVYVAKPGVNPAFAEKVQAYADHVESWTNQLTRNPREALAGLVQEIAGELFETRNAKTQQVQAAQSIISENEAWLYQTDAAGRRMVDHAGKFVPSPAGARYYTHMQSLRQSGVTDPRTLDHLSKQLLQADLYSAGAAQAAQPQAPAIQTTAALARPPVNPGQAVTPTRRSIVAGATEPSGAGRSLSELLREAMAAEGVTDADFALVGQ